MGTPQRAMAQVAPTTVYEPTTGATQQPGVTVIAPVGGQPSQVDPMMVVYKEFDITVLCCCNLCCSCCAPKNTVHTHDTYMVEKLVIPNSCGKCCGDTKYTSAAMYDKLDHLILTRDCTCLSSCPECCFQYGCCPCAQSKMQLGWRNGL